MQSTIGILLMLVIGCATLLTMTRALSDHEDAMSAVHVQRPLASKRFYDFGSRAVHEADDEDLQKVNDDDDYLRFRRFYDFGTRKRFYDFGSKKRSVE